MTPEHGYRGRVVVGFDGSDAAQTAVEWAANEAVARGRGLTIVHALMPPVMTGGLGVGLPTSPDVVTRMENAARENLEAVADTLVGDEIRTTIEVGSPSGVLLEASESADLVVVGSRGHGGFARLMLGSVAAQIAAHADCPVAVIRSIAAAGATEVVVGIDASPGTESALAFAFDEASRHGWSVVAVHAWDVPAYDLLIVPNGPIPVALADVADDEIRLSAEALGGFRDAYPDVEVREHLVQGPPVPALLKASGNPAMIVVGTRGHGPTVGALLGSVSNGILHKSPVPVVVVPQAETAPEAA